MRKLFLYPFFFIISLFIILLVFLSTVGYETDRFNPLLENQIKNYNQRLNAKLNTIKVKINIKNLNFFITTTNPNLTFNNIKINIDKIDAYLDIKSLLIANPNIKKINISTAEIDIKNFKDIVKFIKPSNYKKFILNNLDSGKLSIKIDLNFDQNNDLKDYELNGKVKSLNFYFNKLNFEKSNFIFYFTPYSGELNNIRSTIDGIQISTGKIKYEKNENFEVSGNINSDFKINETFIKKFIDNDLSNQFKSYLAEGKLENKFDIKFDDTLKVIDYNLLSTGEVFKSQFSFLKEKKIFPFKDKIKNLQFKKSSFKFNLNSIKENSFDFKGVYSINDDEAQNFIYSNKFKKNSQNIEFDVNFIQKIEIPILNYYSKDKVSSIISKLNIKKNEVKINDLKFKESKNLIEITDLIISNNNFVKIHKILVKTYKNKKINNDFSLDFGEQITVKGSIFDASSLSKAFEGENTNKVFSKLSKKIKVSLKKITTKFPEPLSNFNLIGEIKKGELVKISSKGEFPNKKYLDISIKKDKKINKTILEIYSDIPEPLLLNYNFFQGLSGGTLTFNSEYDKDQSLSRLVIENFKVKNAPAFVKLLSLADLGGMVDALSGEGLSFEKLEMTFEKNDNVLNLKELYAIGPSLSVLMEGYVENKTNLVSLRGTMVPAKTLNKMLSKIPVVGNIIIPKEIGEGLFGVSFKMKGVPGKIKTSVNPIKTLTPRFIQKALKKPK